jgi:polypeptide N-acetylgalactosaminyltransferase
LENVAPDLMKQYPPVEPAPYASGAIKSMADGNLCVDTVGGGQLGLYSCHHDLVKPGFTQWFELSWLRDVRLKSDEICWDAGNADEHAKISLVGCHGDQKNQLWKYDYVSFKKSV